MRVYRGRPDDVDAGRAESVDAGRAVDADRAATERIVYRVAAEGEPAVRVWQPPRHLAFGRRDAAADGYERAREAARERGFPPVERTVGGRAVAYTGSTVAFARVTPVEDVRSGVSDRYDAMVADVRDALADIGIDATAGEPADSFCPGTHSLQAAGADGRARKIAGIAQRVRRDVAVVAGVLVVRDREEIASVLEPVYDALGVDFDPTTVGSVLTSAEQTRDATGDGDADPDAVLRTVEERLAGSADASVEPLPVA